MKPFIHILCKLRTILFWLIIPIIYSCSGNLSQTIIFEDQFERLPFGYISSPELLNTDYQYIAGAGRSGPWEVTSFGRDPEFKTAWEIVNNNSRIFLQHNYHAMDDRLERKNPHIHSMIIGGDSTWHDYKVSFEFTPKALYLQCGVVFKYVNGQSFYFFGMEGNYLVLKMVQYETGPKKPFERILAAQKFNWNVNDLYRGDVSIRENKIYALLNDSIILFAEDNNYPRGKIGFLSDVPAAFYSLNVTTLNRERRKISRYESQLAHQKAMRINENPDAVMWKKISTKGFGSGNNIRFGDLSGDGEIDLLLGHVNEKQNQAYEGIAGLTALTFDGEILWQLGKAVSEDLEYPVEAPMQIHDIDGDGEREVILIKDGYLQILKGKTGKILNRTKVPGENQPSFNRKNGPGECIYFCDLSGKARESDIIYKDRNQNIYAYNEHLKLLWKGKTPKGHFPHAKDIDGDERDEISVGYSLFDHDGNLIWNRSSNIGDRSNGVLMTSMIGPADNENKIICSAGDWGAIVLDSGGNILSQNMVGYVQNMTVANFRTDLPGLETVSVNFWGSQGIIHFYDAYGKIYHSFELNSYGSMCLPVNWRGDESAYFLLNTNSGDGGIFDGYGKLVVAFPDDGHPDRCNAVIDITGDARDEIVTWNRDEIWVYTQKDNPRKGRIIHSEKNPVFNFSKYQVSYSYPESN